MRGFARIVLALAVLLVPGLASADLLRVAGITDESPEAGFFYKDFQLVQVSDGTDATRKVAFVGFAKGPLRRHCIWRVNSAGDLVAPDTGPIACLKEPSPIPTANYVDFDDLSMNASGALAWIAELSGDSVGVFHEGGKVLAAGDSAGGAATFLDFSFATRLDTGPVVVKADIAGVSSAVNQRIVKCSGGDLNCGGGTGSLSNLVAKGNTVPDGRKICQINEVAANGWGIAFRAGTKLDCANGLESTRLGIFRRADGGSIEEVAVETQAANPPGAVYDTFSGRLDVGAGGRVTFIASVKISGEEAGTHVYLCDPGTCPAAPATQVVAARTVVDGDLLKKFKTVAIDSAGDVAFIAEGTRVCGIYLAPFGGGPIEVVAKDGDQVPGEALGVGFKCFRSLAMSGDGEIATEATYRRQTRPAGGEGVFVQGD